MSHFGPRTLIQVIFYLDIAPQFISCLNSVQDFVLLSQRRPFCIRTFGCFFVRLFLGTLGEAAQGNMLMSLPKCSLFVV